VTAEQAFDVGASAGADRLELGHDLSPTDDREVLAAMFYGVEDVGEVSGCVGGTNFRHRIRLSDRERAEQRRTR
jgi:hypothetical protein